MRYEDASQPDSAGHETVARPDVDTLPAGSYGPATGNAITGQGTSTGSSGEDSVAAGPASIVAVQGAGGQTVAANGAFRTGIAVDGDELHGRLLRRAAAAAQHRSK